MPGARRDASIEPWTIPPGRPRELDVDVGARVLQGATGLGREEAEARNARELERIQSPTGELEFRVRRYYVYLQEGDARGLHAMIDPSLRDDPGLLDELRERIGRLEDEVTSITLRRVSVERMKEEPGETDLYGERPFARVLVELEVHRTDGEVERTTLRTPWVYEGTTWFTRSMGPVIR